MTGLWSAALWLLQLAFKVIDAFTTPTCPAGGPIAPALPMILWIALSVVGIMFLVQLALVRCAGTGRPRASCCWARCSSARCGSATWGSRPRLVTRPRAGPRDLRAMLHVDGFSALDLSRSMPRRISDATVATVLGLSVCCC
jgi:hypothetical protein